MNPTTYDALEAAAFAAWPALEAEQRLLGWRLRFAEGYTKRANSANCSSTALSLLPERIAEIEARYRQRGLPAIFRLTSVAAPAGFDDLLAARGYCHVDPSWVMTLTDLATPTMPPALRGLDAEHWFAAYQHITGSSAVSQQTHLKMLRAIRDRCVYAVEYRNEEPVCCGLAVLSDGQLGLFDIATAAAHRRQGLATRLCRRMLDWGSEQGAQGAYLQVVASNDGAIRIYEKLGFRHAYSYWYRVSV